MKLWKSSDGQAYVFAETAEEAHDLINRGWNLDNEYDEDEWEIVSPGVMCYVTRNPYNKDGNFKDKNMIVSKWEDLPFPEVPAGRPWILIDKDLESDDYFDAEHLYSEEVSSVQLAVRRECPCGGEEKCVVCGGEGTLTKWLDARKVCGEYKLKVKDVDAAFEILNAYALMLQLGYNVG